LFYCSVIKVLDWQLMPVLCYTLTFVIILLL
jgi:hypothetical protein